MTKDRAACATNAKEKGTNQSKEGIAEEKDSISALNAVKSRELMLGSTKIKEIYATSTTKLRSNAKK